MTSFEQNCENSRKPDVTSGSTRNTSRFGQILSEIMVWVIYLWSKVAWFVLFCPEISQTSMFHAVLLISSESFLWVEVHQHGWRLFRAMVWRLLIIESFSQWKLNKIKMKNCTEIWGHSWCCWKALEESDLIEFNSQFSEQV
jgi:hypothetical protein